MLTTEVTGHVRDCADCSSAIEQLASIRQAAAELDELEPAPETWLCIRRSVARPERSPFRWIWAGAVAAAAVVLVVLVTGRTPPAQSAKMLATAAHLPTTREGASAELASHYRDYVRGVDAAITEIETAMAENPSNPRVKMAYLGARTAKARAVDHLYAGGD